MENYDELETMFMDAVQARNAGDEARAEGLFKQILSAEPRMAEPRLELASIHLKRGDLDEAEAHAREALVQLERGWRWLDTLSDEQMMAHACNLLGEILKQQSSRDDVLRRGDAAIKAIWQEAGELFERAAEADPDNAEAIANYIGFKKQRPPRSVTGPATPGPSSIRR